GPSLGHLYNLPRREVDLEFFVATALWAVDESIEMPFFRHFFKSLLVSSAPMMRSILACLGLQCRLLGSAVGYFRLADFLFSKVRTLISCLVCRRHNTPPDWRPGAFQRDF